MQSTNTYTYSAVLSLLEEAKFKLEIANEKKILEQSSNTGANYAVGYFY